MTEDPFHFHRIQTGLSQAFERSRPARRPMLVVIGVVALGLVAMTGLRSIALPGPAPLDPNNRLTIEVVKPVEPDIIPGSRMEVGELVDGFRYVAPRPEPEAPVFVEYVEEERPEPPPYGRQLPREDAFVRPPPQPPRMEPDRRERRRYRWFGFDEPRRDFRAERDARRAAYEDRARVRRDNEWRDRERGWRERSLRQERDTGPVARRQSEAGMERRGATGADVDPG